MKTWFVSALAASGCLAATALPALPAAAQSGNEAQLQQAVRQIFQRFDGNGDGTITDTEFMRVGQRDFATLDVDGDSIIVKTEFLDPKPRAVDGLDSKNLARAKEVWGRQFALLDADQNGKLTAREHEAAGKQSFARMDGNKDGEVTLAEMTAAATAGR